MAIVTLALGIGAAAAMYAVVEDVLVRPLPYANADRLVWIWSVTPGRSVKQPASNPDFTDWRSQSRTLDIAGWGGYEANLTGMGGEPERLMAALTMGDFFTLLGVPPLLGALDRLDDARPDEPTVVLGNRIWQRRFGADPNVVGRPVTLNNLVYTVAGVMPPDFRFPIQSVPSVDLWIPLVRFNPFLAQQRGARLIEVIGRLRPGAGLDEAQAEMDLIASGLSGRYPETNRDLGIDLVPAIEEVTGTVSRSLWTLFAAAGCLLLIASANLANLLVARASARREEIGVRRALGAARGRIALQLLIESALISLTGGALGSLVAYWGVSVFARLVPPDLPRASEIGVDIHVLAFAVVSSLSVGLLFGLAPVWHSRRSDPVGALQRGGTAGVSGNRFRGALVVAEIAIAMIVLTGAGLLMNSFWRLSRSAPGFDPGNVLTFALTWPSDRYPRPMEVFGDLQARLLAIPGVQAASTGLQLPDRGLPMIDDAPLVSEIDGMRLPEAERLGVSVLSTQPGYFSAMGIPLVEGRDFVEADMTGRARVAIINQSLAQAYFPDTDPIGKRFTLDSWTLPGASPAEIVGVAGDVKHRGLSTAAELTAYLPLSHRPVWSSTVVVRTAGDPLAYAGAVREVLRGIDPDQPIVDMQTLEQRIADSIAEDGFRALFLAVFAATAVVLAAIGLYGVLAYVTTTRRREVVIRMALGARSWQVRLLVLGQGLSWALTGTAIGIAGALMLTRLIDSLLFGVAATDPATLVAVTGILLLVAVAACWIPARYATKIDPSVAMRFD